MYRWKVKKYTGAKALKYRAYSKRMDVLKMKGKHEKIMLSISVPMMGYRKYIWFLEFGSLDGFSI